MKSFIKSPILWRFLGGFALGGLGVLAMHPAGAQTVPQAPAAIVSSHR